MAESWYLTRARANMKIANYAAAIEAYRKALDRDPGNREASRGIAVALLRNGETDGAVAELDRHLARFPDDAELAFEQARLLQWSRYAYRSRDAVKYLRLGLRTRDDPARRRDLARLLARDRATLDDAVAEYRRLVAAAPDDRALRGEYLKVLLWDRRHRDEALGELERQLALEPANERLERERARLVAEDPRRSDEAAERYGALLARHPGDAELRLGRARALARAGRRDEAREEYARVLAAKPTVEARLEHAELLAGDPRARDAARREYEAVLRASPGSRRGRLGLARLLAARKETSRDAIGVYEAVLRDAPKDAEAHRGLARAYAWNGDPDRALAHGALAERYAPPRAETTALARSLRVGREPAVGGGVRTLAQPTGTYRLARTGAFVSGTAEPTPFTSSSVEAGFASASGDGAQASGAFVDVRGELRPGVGSRLRGAIGWDGARRASAVTGELSLSVERGDEAGFLLRLARTARTDSFRAYAGEEVDGVVAGAATEHVLEVRRAFAGRTRLELGARAGAVTASGARASFLAGVSGRADRALLRRGTWTIGAGAALDAVHHARELSGDGAPGDVTPHLFSPPVFLSASPRLVLSRDAGARGRLTFDAGPALQVVGGAGGGVRAGGDARLALSQRVGERLRLGAEARAERIADAYARLDAAITAAILFP